MGGGDIKLMAVFGLMIGWKMSIITIFLSAFIALPVSIFILKTNKNHEKKPIKKHKTEENC